MGFLKNAKVVSENTSLKPLQGAKVVLPNAPIESVEKPTEEKSFLTKALEGISDVVSYIPSHTVTPLVENVMGMFSPKSLVGDKQSQANTYLEKLNEKEPVTGIVLPKTDLEVYQEFNNFLKTDTFGITPKDFQKTDSILKQLNVTPKGKVEYNQDGSIKDNFTLDFGSIENKDVYDKTIDDLENLKNQKLNDIKKSLKEQEQKEYQNISNFVLGKTPIVPKLKTEEVTKKYENLLKEETKKVTEQYNTLIGNIVAPQIAKNNSFIKPEKDLAIAQLSSNTDESIQKIQEANNNLQEFLTPFKQAQIKKENGLTFSGELYDILGRQGIDMTFAGDNKKRDVKLANFVYGDYYKNAVAEGSDPLFQGSSNTEKDKWVFKGLKDQISTIDVYAKKTQETLQQLEKTDTSKYNREQLNKYTSLVTGIKENLNLLKNSRQELTQWGDTKLKGYKQYISAQKEVEDMSNESPISSTIAGFLKASKNIPTDIAKFYQERFKLGSEEGKELVSTSEKSDRKVPLEDVLQAQMSTDKIEDIEPSVIEKGLKVPLSQATAISVFNDEGNFVGWKNVISPRPLFYQALKTTRDMALLGGVGGAMETVAGGALERTVLKNLAKAEFASITEQQGYKLLYNGANVILSGAKFGNRATAMIVPTAVLYGHEMYNGYIEQGFTPEQSRKLTDLSVLFEGGSEAIFGNEIKMFNAFTGKVENSILRKESEEIFEKAIQERTKAVLKREATSAEISFAKKMFLNLERFKNNGVVKALGEGLSTNLEESGEEVFTDWANATFTTPLAQSYKPDYEGEEFSLENEVNTILNTVATMPFMTYQGVKTNLKNQKIEAAQAKYEVGKAPDIHIGLINEQFKNGDISKEEYENRLLLINKFSELQKQSKAVSENPVFSDYSKNEKDNLQFNYFNTLLKKQKVEEQFLTATSEEDKAKFVTLLDETNQELFNYINKGLYNNKEQRTASNSINLDYLFNDKSVKGFKEESDILKTVKQLQLQFEKESDNILREKYQEKIDLLNKRVVEIAQEKEELNKTPKQKAQENNQKQSLTIEKESGNTVIPFNTPYYLSSIDETSVEGATVKKRPLITVLQDNGDGTIQIAQDGEVSTIPIESLKDYKFTRKDTVDKWKKESAPEGFVFEHENDVFTYEFSKSTDSRDKTVPGRIRFNPLTNNVEFVYKDKQGEVQTTNLSKSDLKSVNKGKLKYVRTLETESEFNSRKSEIEKNAQLANFDKLQNQTLRRWEFIKKYVESKKQEILNTKTLISKVEDELLDVEIELEKLQKELDSKETLTTKKGKKRVDVTKLFNKLNSLQTKHTELSRILDNYNKQKEDLEKEIEYINQYEGKEFDSNKSLIDQLVDEQFDLEVQLEQVNGFIDNIKSLITGIENTIKKIGETITNLISGFEKAYGKERLSSFDADFLNELKQIDKLFSEQYPDVKTFLQKNPEYFKNLLKFNELVNDNLDKIDLSEKDIANLQKSLQANIGLVKSLQDKIRYQENLIKEALIEQNKFQEENTSKKLKSIADQIFNSQKESETKNLVNSNEEDLKLAKQEEAKIELTEFFATTTSGVTENGNLNLDNPQVLRLQNFLNNVENPSKYSILVITKDNAKQYGLESILYTDESTTNKTDNEDDNDIKLVIVYNDNGKISFVDENENLMQDAIPTKIVYTSLRKAKLTRSNGDKAYHSKDRTEEQEKDLASKLELNHKDFRTKLIEASKLDRPITFSIKYISRGFETTKGQENPVESILPAGTDLNNKEVIVIPNSDKSSTAPIIYNGNKAIPMPVGRPVLSLNQHFGFLNAKQFSTKEAEKFALIFKSLYNAWKNGDKEQVKIIEKYLQKTLYFRNPEKISKLTDTTQNTKIGRSQIWFSNVNNTIHINLGEDFSIPFNFEEGNIDALATVQAFFLGKEDGGVYHNVDNQKLIGEPFTEITGVNKDGKLITQQWNSYQEYLLSDKTPNGEKREINDIPLTINRAVSTPLSPNMAGRYIIFENKSNTNVTNTAKQSFVSTKKENIEVPTVPDFDTDTQEENKLENQDITKLSPNKTYRYRTKDNKFIDFTVDSKNNVQVKAHNFGMSSQQIAVSMEQYTKGISQKPSVAILYELKEKTPTETFEKPSSLLNYNKTEENKEGFTQPKSLLDYKKATKEEKQSTAPLENSPTSTQEEEDWTSKLQVLDIPKNETKKDDDFHYRKATKKNYKLENLEEAKKWWVEKFPQIPFELAFGLIDGKAWGRIKNAVLTLSDIAEEGTVYHEAFEVVYNYILSPKQITALNKEFKNRKGSFIDYETGKTVQYSKATDYQIKEQLAEETREFILSNGKKKWEGEYNKNSFFRKIWAWIESKLFTSPDTIQEVFEKIATGAYKDNVINNNQNINANYKVADVQLTNPVFFNDVMKSMTSLLFETLSVQNRSIPEIFTDNYNIDKELGEVKKKIDSFYGGEIAIKFIDQFTKESFVKMFQNANAQQFVLDKFKNLAPNMLRNLKDYAIKNNLSRNQFAEKLFDVLNNYQYISDNYEELKQKNKEYLAIYKIEFTESNDELDEELVNNESKDQNDYLRDVLKLSRKLNANTEIKLLIATLREMEIITTEDIHGINSAIEVKPILNTLLMSNLVDYNKTVVSLLYKLSPATTFDEMVEILKKEATHNPSFQQLIKKLKIDVPTTQLSQYDVDLRNKFLTSLNNLKVKYKKLILNPEDYSGNSFDLNEENAINIIKTKWFNNTKANSKLFPINPKTKQIELNKSALPVKTITNFDSAIQLLNALGYEYNFDYKRLSSDEKESILKSSLSLFKTLTTNSPDLLFYNSPLVREQLNTLAELYIKYTDNYAEPQHMNIDREPVQNIILHNFIGIISKSLNISKSLDEFIKKIPQLNPNSEGNAWLSYSQILSPNSLFFKDGKLKKPLSIEILEGSEVREASQGTATSKLSLSDRIAQEFAFNLQGLYYILTPADTKTEWGVNFGHFVTQAQAKDNTYILNIFKNYLKAEIATAQQENTSNLKNLNKAKNQLRFFKDILDFNLVIDDNKTSDQIIKENESKINNSILNWLDTNAQKDFEEFKDNKIITAFKVQETDGFKPIGKAENLLTVLFAPKEFIGEGLTENEVKDLIKFNNINYVFNIFEQHKLFWGDPAQWKDITKRIKPFTSGRNLSVVDANYFNEFNNKKLNTLSFINSNGDVETIDLQPGDFGYSFYNDKIRTQTYSDVEVFNEYLEDYPITNEADAQGYAFPNGYREIRQRANSWSEADEEQKQWDDALCRKDNNLYPQGKRGEKLREYDNYLIKLGNPYLNRAKASKTLPTNNVLKPIYSGFKDGDVATINLDKLSLAPLTWRLVKGTNAEKFYLEHFKKNTTYIKFNSAQKVGETNDTQPMYDEKGNPNLNVQHEELSFKYFGIQVETATQKAKTTLGTQLTKLINLGLDFIKHRNYIDKNNSLLSALKIMSKNQIFEEFGIVEKQLGNKKVFEFTNFEAIESLIQNELKNRDATENLKLALKVNPDTGRFYLPFDLVIGSDKVEALITSIIDNNILRPKMFGGQMPQIASTLFEKNKRIYKKHSKSGKEYLVSNELKFYKDKDGERYCEIYLPFYMQEYISKGKELNINDLPEDLKFGVGFRIPTQNTNSIENFKIKGFLPVEYGNSIVVPSEITTKAGSDFDIDKLNIYLYNYKINQKTGKPEKIKFLNDSNSTAEQRYKNLQKKKNFFEFLNTREGYDYYKASLDESSTSLINDIFDEDLTDGRLDLTKSYDENLEIAKENSEQEASKIISFDKFKELPIEQQNSRKAVENAYIDNIRNVLQLPEMFEQLIKPNSAEELKQEAKEINSLWGINKEQKSSDYHLSRVNNAKDRHAFSVGKDAVGIGASQQTQNAIGQIVGLSFKDKINGKYRLNFPTNSTINGDVITYSLAEKLDKAGKTISDTISMFIDSFVDIAKDPYIFDINGNLETASIYISGVRMGIPLNLLTRWFSQPIVKDYIIALQNNKSLSTDLKNSKQFKKDLIAQLLSKYKAQESLERIKDFSKEELESYIKEYVNDPENTTQEFKDAQYHLLQQFRALENISWSLFRFGRAVNLDTSRTVSFESIRIKMAHVQAGLNDPLFGEFVKTTLNNTFIGSIFDAKIELLESIKPLYLSESDAARNVLNPILNSIYNAIGKQAVLEEEAKKLRKHFITYLLHTIPFQFGNSSQATYLTSYIDDLLLSDSNIAIRLRNLQSAQQEGKLPDNFFTKNMFGVIPAFVQKQFQKTKNVRLNRKFQDKVEKDLITSDFRNLVNHPLTESILHDLVKTALLQSGLNADPFSFAEYIPNEIFQEIAKQINSYFENSDIEEVLQNFSNSYYQNQWYNQNLVPKASLKKSTVDKKTGQFKDRIVNWTLKTEKDEKVTIPFLEYFVESSTINAMYSKEARNPYLITVQSKKGVDGTDMYTKYEKEQMAKKGDFSFLESTLYKRLELFNEDTKQKDIPLISKETPFGTNYLILFYPVNSYGEKFNLVEHYTFNNKSKINPYKGNMTDEKVYNLLKINKKTSERFLFQHIFPNLQQDSEDFITKLDKSLNNPMQMVQKTEQPIQNAPETGKPGVFTVWHGSETDIKEFKSEFPEGFFHKAKGGSPKAIFFSKDKAPSNSVYGKRPYQKQFQVTMNNPLVVNYTNPKGDEGGKNREQWIQEAIDKGHDGVIWRNIHDNFITDVYVSLDSKKIKAVEQPIQNKEGIDFVFEQTPELANAVYEALGFSSITIPNEKEVNIRLSKINDEHNLGNIKDLDGEPIYEFEQTILQNGLVNLTSNQWGHGATRTPYGKEGIEKLENILSKKDEFTGDFGPIAGTKLSETNKYANTWENGRFIITRNDDNFYSEDGSLNINGIEIILNRSFEPYGNYLANKYPNVIFKDAFGNKINSTLEITPQQKQQAQQLYQSFLDVYLQDFEQVESVLKKEKIIDKKCS